MANVENLTCSICFDVYHAACVASCGHSFCSQCILSYWRTGDQESPVKCPLDRSTISFLVPNFTVRDQIAAIPENPQPDRPATVQELDIQLATYNQKFSHLPRGFGQELREDVALYRNLPSNSTTVWLIRILFIGAFFYFVMPIDLIPENGTISGYLDDAFVIFVVLIIILSILNSIRTQMIRNAAQR